MRVWVFALNWFPPHRTKTSHHKEDPNPTVIISSKKPTLIVRFSKVHKTGTSIVKRFLFWLASQLIHKTENKTKNTESSNQPTNKNQIHCVPLSTSTTTTLLLQTEYGADDPVWIDEAWLDTVVVVGLTCFVLCLMNLSKVCLNIFARRNDKSLCVCLCVCVCVTSIHPACLSRTHIHFWILLDCLSLSSRLKRFTKPIYIYMYRSPRPKWECSTALPV
jgi:hypothetical protein